mgnify:FL=1
MVLTALLSLQENIQQAKAGNSSFIILLQTLYLPAFILRNIISKIGEIKIKKLPMKGYCKWCCLFGYLYKTINYENAAACFFISDKCIANRTGV